MSTDSDASSVSRRQFLAVASGAAAAGSISVGKVLASPPPPPPPVSYTVTIDVSSGSPSYSVSPTGNPRRLYVKDGDTVKWKATTRAAHHRLTILFVKETPFIDVKSKRPVYAFHGNEADEGGVGIGGTATLDPIASGAYEYSVAVFDDDNVLLTYTDDPKIIVGSGNIVTPSEVEVLTGVLQELKGLKTPPDQREKIKSIEEELKELINKLQ